MIYRARSVTEAVCRASIASIQHRIMLQFAIVNQALAALKELRPLKVNLFKL
jgi:hypothetical protein